MRERGIGERGIVLPVGWLALAFGTTGTPDVAKTIPRRDGLVPRSIFT